MEQKPKQQTAIVIKEEVTDVDDNFITKNDAVVDQRSNKVNSEELLPSLNNDHQQRCTNNVTKIERNGSLSPPTPSLSIPMMRMPETNSRNRRSPKCTGVIMGMSRSVSVVSPATPSNVIKPVARTSLLTSPSSDSTNPSLVPFAAPNSNCAVSNESEHTQVMTTKNLGKIRRLLGTLLQFAKMMSTEVAETVKVLIFNLACNTISVEEFHSNLQEAITDFPLRPFVLPFLRNYVPILQKEINLHAKLTKQSVQLYVRQNENIILDPFCSTSDLNDVFNSMVDPSVSSSNQRNEIFSNNLFMGKRRHECFENSSSCNRVDQIHESQPPLKKHAAPSTLFPSTVNNMARNNTNNYRQGSLFHPVDYFRVPPPPSPFSSGTGNSWPPPTPTSSTKDCITNNNENKNTGNNEWDNINMMLNCILSMVEKTKKALAILQDRNTSDQNCADVIDGEASSNSNSSHDSRSKKCDVGDEMQKSLNQMMAQTMRLTEERVAFVLKRAEEAVNEIKRRAVLELQKALGTSNGGGNVLKMPHESKQSNVVNDPQSEYSTQNDFSIGDRLCDSSSLFYPFLQTNDSWNCGRRIEERCNGRNLNKYCSPFFQQKD